MIYVFYTVLTIILIFLLFNYLRKLHWDAIHHNLLDLVDEIGGEIYRRGFLSRPIYHGEYKGNEIAINFSLEKMNNKRVNYLDISLGKEFRNSVTVSSLKWLQDRRESTENYLELDDTDIREYGILKKDLQRVFKGKPDADFIKNVKKLVPFTYIFIGQTGILFEMECNNFAQCTKHPQILNLIEILSEISKIIK